jgi:type II secretion system protein G
MRQYRNRQSGFTLVEILIVVIILGILAAIVIPQFTNASQDARKNSLTSQLQTIRSQLELYKLQHKDQLPLTFQTDGVKATWAEMTKQTDADHANYTGAAGQSGPFGPYLQQDPVNSLSGSVELFVQQSDATLGGNSPSVTSGWILNRVNGKCWATSSKGAKVYNEADASDPNNDL